MKELFKRLDRFEKDCKLAAKSNAKLKLGPRYKFGPFHFYRRVLLGLTIGEDLLGDEEWKPSGVPFGEHSVSWNEWNTRIKKVCPLQFYFRQRFYLDVYRFFKISNIKDWFYYLQCKFYYKFNVLKIKTLPPTWCDECELIVHAIFAVLERFMEQKPSERHDYSMEYKEDYGMTREEWEEHQAPHALFWKEISQAWDWWNKRDERQKQLDLLLNEAHNSGRKGFEEKYGKYNKLEEQFDKEEEEMLLLILKHRKRLWV